LNAFGKHAASVDGRQHIQMVVKPHLIIHLAVPRGDVNDPRPLFRGYGLT